jgi:hypothetical protein
VNDMKELITPIQVWFLTQTSEALPAEGDYSTLEAAILKKINGLKRMSGWGGAIKYKRELDEIIGYAMYYAAMEEVEDMPELIALVDREYSGTSLTPPKRARTEVRNAPAAVVEAIDESILDGEIKFVDMPLTDCFDNAIMRGKFVFGFDESSNPVWGIYFGGVKC